MCNLYVITYSNIFKCTYIHIYLDSKNQYNKLINKRILENNKSTEIY